MGHFRPGGPGGEGGGSRVGEEVQNLRPVPVRGEHARPRVYVFPVRGLLGKDSHMLEGGHPEAQLHPEAGRAGVADIPLPVHLPELLPCAAVLLAGPAEACSGHEDGMRPPVPFALRQAFVPERFRLRACEHVVAEALQLLSGAAVNQFVVLPVCSGIFDHGEINLRQNYRLFIDLAKTECFSENLLNL